ncbi:hypothetical protein SAMN05660649_00435 [Desulfotomaculum arcticum]|uniref:Uncharacterized protein n=1 Tax=Desulfotruncus arcticus DSM 17038 TaxID=1121424 RepID=A0A1I2N9F1_9FIRM|nr:hypothetical protein [Desulfotruncus arcticus]SFG00372.1 hypothetical protein SAMN05660649_00435 [Desulfotomaculum arcticum] [Desulfotruncus arcticus DSM 17038]
MASPRLKNNYQEAALSIIRILTFTAVTLIVGLSVWLTAVVAGASWGLAGAIGGTIAGITGFCILVCGSLYEVKNFTCPSCGKSDHTLKQIGYYNCSECGTKYHIYDKEINSISA